MDKKGAIVTLYFSHFPFTLCSIAKAEQNHYQDYLLNGTLSEVALLFNIFQIVTKRMEYFCCIFHINFLNNLN